MSFIRIAMMCFVFILMNAACSKPQQFSALKEGIDENTSDGPGDIPKPTPPTLVWVQFPNGPVATNEDTTLIYDIIPGSSPVTSIVCKVDGVVVSCSTDGGTLIVKNPVSAKHVVDIAVKDANNLTASGSVNWQAFGKFQKVKIPLDISSEENQADILVVIDNSPSMRSEQKNMADRISNLLDRVNGLDWRIGIVTTDMSSQSTGSGRLLQFPNKSYFITAKMDLAEAKKQFGETIQREEQGSSNEQGIRATFRAITRAFLPKDSKDKFNADFFRSRAALSVIVVSDENETGDLKENKPKELVALVREKFGLGKIFKFHSIVVRPGDTICRQASSEHIEGISYAEMTALTGGIMGDICAKDYGNQLTIIGQDVVNTQNTYQLTCVPMDVDGDGKVDISIVSSNTIPGFVLDKDKIVFSKPPPAGKYSIEYFCPKK
jgi:hypothetical protein